MVSRGQAGPNPTRAATASEVQEVGPAPMHDDGIVGHISGYAMPNISSMLPNYSNSEQEFIFRTFNVGNYDLLKHLPDGIKEQQVMAVRTARMAATRRFLMPALSQPLIRSKPSNQQDLFSTFDYIPSRFSLADELASKERVESEAKRMAVGGREFIPSGNVSLPKYKDNAENSTFPFVGGSYEGADDARLAQTCLDRGGVIVDKPWVHSGTDKLGDQPTKMAAWQMMSDVRKWIAKDWEEVDVTIFENDHDCWVVRIPLDKVDSEQGLLAYMNVFIRCNELVNSYKIHKVVDFWGTTPGDGSMYFVFRPPWVKPDRIATYYALFPEVRPVRALQVVTSSPFSPETLQLCLTTGEELANDGCSAGFGSDTLSQERERLPGPSSSNFSTQLLYTSQLGYKLPHWNSIISSARKDEGEWAMNTGDSGSFSDEYY